MSTNLTYEVGDKVQFKNLIFIMDAEILEVYSNGEYEDFDYYIRYEDYEGYKEDVMVREKDLVGFTKGTEKYLKQELDKLIKDYSKEHILNVLKEI